MYKLTYYNPEPDDVGFYMQTKAIGSDVCLRRTIADLVQRNNASGNPNRRAVLRRKDDDRVQFITL